MARAVALIAYNCRGNKKGMEISTARTYEIQRIARKYAVAVRSANNQHRATTKDEWKKTNLRDRLSKKRVYKVICMPFDLS